MTAADPMRDYARAVFAAARDEDPASEPTKQYDRDPPADAATSDDDAVRQYARRLFEPSEDDGLTSLVRALTNKEK